VCHVGFGGLSILAAKLDMVGKMGHVWWEVELELQASMCNPDDSLGKMKMMVFLFIEIQMATDAFGQWWWAADINTIVDLGDDQEVKAQQDEIFDVAWAMMNMTMPQIASTSMSFFRC
jgi:hypothetical protein